MKLTFEIIRDELAGRISRSACYRVSSGGDGSNVSSGGGSSGRSGGSGGGVGHPVDCGGDGSPALIEAPKLYEDGMEVSADYCYVAESMPAEQGCLETGALFIICGTAPADVPPESIQPEHDQQERSRPEDTQPGGAQAGAAGNLLYFSAPQPVRRVMNALLDVFAKYRKWMDALLESLLGSGSAGELLELSLPVFENPLFLIDSRFSRVAQASPDDAENYDPHMEKVDETWIIRGKDELLDAMGNSAPFFRHLPGDHPRLFINLTEGEYLLGNLSIQASCRPLREGDAYLLEQLAAVVHTAMLRLASSDDSWRGRLEAMLSGIITGGVVNEEEFNQTLSYFGYTKGDLFRCLAIRLPKPSGKEFIRNFLQLLGTQVPAMYIPVSGEVVAIVISVSSAIRQGPGALALMETKLAALGFRVGVSDPYGNLLLTQQYFAQARYALERGEVAQAALASGEAAQAALASGEAAQAGKSVALFSDYCLDYILENVSGELKPDMLWNEGFRKLVAHDVKGRANYVETLRAYLDNNLNAHRAAATLYISRNSLLAQLERIQALLGEDLKDPKVRFRYELSLLLYDKWEDDAGG